MEIRCANIARVNRLFRIGLKCGAGQEFLGRIALHCWRGHDAPRKTQRVSGHLPVFFRAQIIRRDFWRLHGVR